MSKKLEGVHLNFIRKMTGKREVQQEYGTWSQVAEEKTLENAGTQSLGTYTDRRQDTVEE